jgi:hypothetical protein
LHTKERMASRRDFISSITAIGGLEVLQACSLLTNADCYEQSVQNTWRQAKANTHDKTLLFYELLRYATLGPSS